MRGNHDGSFTFAHELRDGMSWDDLGRATPPDELYDLVIVGGGISGLAAAHRITELLPHAELSLFEAADRLGGEPPPDWSATTTTTPATAAVSPAPKAGRQIHHRGPPDAFIRRSVGGSRNRRATFASSSRVNCADG